uniref:Uncharacterized protein n=1 Tax=Utricularia reniformis TaxID=192314 RepID=A0A1Y0B4Q5_9LAMI|nr:hypothetical protein AEK19_MT2290 [Utricularia reniformis]ART32435.1 hypothetical protein AEK19_MT2290 [Utricularia reniformis]
MRMDGKHSLARPCRERIEGESLLRIYTQALIAQDRRERDKENHFNHYTIVDIESPPRSSLSLLEVSNN